MLRPDEDALSAFDATPFSLVWSERGHATEESVYAWLDGALASSESEALRQHVEACRECSVAVAEARGYIAASSRILAVADVASRPAVTHDVGEAAARIAAITDGGRLVTHPSRVETRAPRSSQESLGGQRRWWPRAAAAAVLIATGTYFATRRENAPIQMDATSVTQAANVAPNERAEAAKLSSVSTDAVSPELSSPQSKSLAAKSAVGGGAGAAAGPPRVANVGTRQRKGNESSVSAKKSGGDVQLLPDVAVQATATTQRVRLGFATSAIAAAEPTGARKISGTIVDRSTMAPIDAANILVPGTTQMVTSDASGNFVLRDVSLSAQKLQVRRLGYDVLELPLDSLAGADGAIRVSLTPATMALSEVIVTAASEPKRSSATACFTANAELARIDAPLVRSISARRQTQGTYDAVLAGWPDESAHTKIILTSDKTGVLRGVAREGSSRVEVELVPRGRDWVSTVREYRGANVRSENLRYMRDQLVAGCSMP